MAYIRKEMRKGHKPRLLFLCGWARAWRWVFIVSFWSALFSRLRPVQSIRYGSMKRSQLLSKWASKYAVNIGAIQISCMCPNNYMLRLYVEMNN